MTVYIFVAKEIFVLLFIIFLPPYEGYGSTEKYFPNFILLKAFHSRYVWNVNDSSFRVSNAKIMILL